MLTLLALTALAASPNPGPFDPVWPEAPWWSWPAPPDASVPGPCAADYAYMPDAAFRPWATYTYDGPRLVQVTTQSWQATIAWEGGRPVEEMRTWTSPGGQDYNQVYTYDEAGRVMKMERFIPSGGSMVRLGLHEYGYDASGLATHASGASLTTYTREDGRIAASRAEWVRKGVGPAQLPTERFTWKDGRIATRTETGERRTFEWRYTWDDQGRLVAVDTTEARARFRYDCD